MLNSPIEDLIKAIDNFSKDLYEITQIFLANPDTLLKMDMRAIPNSVWFIAQDYIEIGKVGLVTDKNMKRTLYKFCEENPDRFFKGMKDTLN